MAEDEPQGSEPVEEIRVTGDNAVMSARLAAQTLAGIRHKRDNPDDKPVPQPEREAPADTKSADEADTAAVDVNQPTGDETTEVIDPAQKPPIEPPRSWSKEARERWSKLDPDTQEYLLTRDRDDSAAVRKAQNDAAVERKAIEAERAKVGEARAHYEAALPGIQAMLQQQQMGEFADIKSMADVETLARTDWPRYVLWDAQQKRIAAVQQEAKAATDRQNQEKGQKLATFIADEAKLFAEKAPEAADPEKFAALQKSAVSTLRELGFRDDELGKLWRGESELSLHDHRLQLLIRDGVRYRDAQAKAKTATLKPVPPVQRPGSSQPRRAAQDAVVQTLAKRLENSGNLKDAARLLTARRQVAR